LILISLLGLLGVNAFALRGLGRPLIVGYAFCGMPLMSAAIFALFARMVYRKIADYTTDHPTVADNVSRFTIVGLVTIGFGIVWWVYVAVLYALVM
jgi:hypothetical protein